MSATIVPSVFVATKGKLTSYDEAFILKNEETGAVIPHAKYRIENAAGKVLAEGRADGEGRTTRVYTAKAEGLKVFVLDL